ncbi:MAG: hypothetical protein ABJA98_15595 [Acidobacteriota bacterium]
MPRPALLITLTALVAAFSSIAGEAHKPITSPYTYNNDVFPILRDQCGRCHAPGGVAPMSLMTYKEAFPWGESIRTELIAGHMPPGATDQAAGTFRSTRELSARELNILLVWLTGGTPMGNAEHSPPTVALPQSWPLGVPDLVIPMPSTFSIAGEATEDRQEIVLQTHIAEPRWLRAVDLLPGTPAIVRSATVSVKPAAPVGGSEPGRATNLARRDTDELIAAERMLAVWSPGDTPVALDGGPAFQLPANAELVLRVHYKKTWENERLAMTDRSSVGLYFAAAPATALRALTVAPSDEVVRAFGSSRASVPPENGSQSASLSFDRIVDEDLEAVALYFDGALANVHLAVQAERPDGTRVDLIRFRPQADWAKRYWLATPVSLPRGTRITVTAMLADVLLPPGAAPLASKRPDASALRLTVNVVGKND